MKIYLSNQGGLRNYKNFVETLDLSEPSKLEITTHNKWITAHPANLALTAALAIQVGKKNSHVLGEVPKSGLYLDRMGLYNLTSTKSPFLYEHKEPAGRFIPIRIVKTPAEQSRVIADIIPLLHLSEHSATVIKYVLGELIRNVLEHAHAKDGAIVVAQYYKKPTASVLRFATRESASGRLSIRTTLHQPTLTLLN